MPDGRRPGLWKTLVAAAQTAIDRLADGVESLADGMRSLGRGRAPAPPTDPRLVGVDPALAAYVAANDPAWFSFEAAPSPGAARDTGPTIAGDSAFSRASPPIVTVSHPAATPRPPADPPAPERRPRPWRTVSTIVELPVDRAVPPPGVASPGRRDDAGAAGAAPASRVSFRPRRPPAPAGVPEERVARKSSAEDDPRAESETAGSTGRTGRAGRRPAPDDSAPRVAPSRSPHPEPSAATVGFPMPPPSSLPPTASPATVESAAPYVQPPDAAGPAFRPAARPADPAPAPWPRSESARLASLPTARAPFAAPPSPTPPTAHPAPQNLPHPLPSPSQAQPTAPVPWPDLPPSRWAEPAPHTGGRAAWAAATGADALVDEQRSM